MKTPKGIRVRGNSIQTFFPDPKNPGKMLTDSESVDDVTQTIVNQFAKVRTAFLVEWKEWTKNPKGPSPYLKYYKDGNNKTAFSKNGGDQLTIAQRFEAYHDERVREGKIELSTLISNKSEMDLLCGGDFGIGKIYISDLTRRHLQDIIKNWTVKRKTIKNRFDHLKAIIHEAMTDGIVDTNLFDGWKPKFNAYHDSTYKKQAYSADEIMDILVAAKEAAPQYYAMLLFHATMGMRCGEVYGLKWKYYNEARNEIEIAETRVKGKQKSNPKTEAGKRTLKLNAFSLAAIKIQLELTYEPEGLIFQNLGAQNDDLAWGDKSAPRQWKKVIKKAGVRDLTTKILRHSFATIAFDTGELPIETLSNILGHSDIKVTKDNYVVKSGLKSVSTDIIETALDLKVLGINESK